MKSTMGIYRNHDSRICHWESRQVFVFPETDRGMYCPLSSGGTQGPQRFIRSRVAEASKSGNLAMTVVWVYCQEA